MIPIHLSFTLVNGFFSFQIPNCSCNVLATLPELFHFLKYGLLSLIKNNLFLFIKVLSECNIYLVPNMCHVMGTRYKAVNRKT